MIDFGPAVERDHAASYDALWRKRPAVPGFIQLARALPGYAAQFRARVPDEFTAQVATGVVQVSCPCSAAPLLPTNQPTICDCGRVFVSFAGSVRVAYLDGREPD